MIRTHKFALMLAVCALALIAAPTAMAASPAEQGYDETTVLGHVKTPPTPTPTPTPTPEPEATPAPVQETAPVAEEAPVQETAPVAVESVTTEPTSSESSLPFTGADLGVLVLMGLLLGGTGLVLRRVVRQRPTA